MAREISPMCDLIFGSIRTSLLTDMVDIDVTIWTVMGIYMYKKEKIIDIDEVPFSKLHIGQGNHKEEPLDVMELLVPPTTTLATLGDNTKNTDEGLTEVEEIFQREKEKFKMYDRIYVGLLSD